MPLQNTAHCNNTAAHLSFIYTLHPFVSVCTFTYMYPVTMGVWHSWEIQTTLPSSNNRNGLCLMSADCVIGYAVRVLTWVRACVWLHTPGDAWIYFLRVCVTVCCMQPCEAVFPLAASRLLFPKQDAGFGSGLRTFVCTHLFNTECVHKCMLDSPQVLFHFCLCDSSVHLPVAIST